MTKIKKLIQKEDFIASKINKYISQTGKLPQKSDNSFDWPALLDENYLGKDFNKYNYFTKKDIYLKFDKDKNIIIYGLFGEKKEPDSSNNYIYEYYKINNFRVKTFIPKLDNTRFAAKVIYSSFVKKILYLLNENEIIVPKFESCTKNKYFYELRDNKVVRKYCKGDASSFDVYQKDPIFLENKSDLIKIKSDIGAKAYVKDNNNWFAYYYQGDVLNPWKAISQGTSIYKDDESKSIEDRIISYIPNAKDLLLRSDGGCMLSNGDIFCWGNNSNKKMGIEYFGQIDHTLRPNYINVPVMLKVQIDNEYMINSTTRRSKKWFNNPYRIKFEKMSFNNKQVCGISPIFTYKSTKFGGDLYCNGFLQNEKYEDMSSSDTTSILKRNKFFAKNKKSDKTGSSSVFLKDIVMVDDTTVVLSDKGKIFTFGSNDKFALGNKNMDENYFEETPSIINPVNLKFNRIFALRELKCFGALDENNNFWIWGEGVLPESKMKKISDVIFSSDYIFVSDKYFILKDVYNRYFSISSSASAIALPSAVDNALSVSMLDLDNYLYIDKERRLQSYPSSLLECFGNCDNKSKKIFTDSINKFNEYISETKDKEVNKFANFSNVSIYKSNYSTYVKDFEKDKSKGDIIIGQSDKLSKYIEVKKNNKLNSWIYLGAINRNKESLVSYDVYLFEDIKESDVCTILGLRKDKCSYKKLRDNIYRISTKGRTNFNGYLAFNISIIEHEKIGIDNININISGRSDNYFICALTGLNTKSQMYCWGDVGRSLPLVNTSLYDLNKIRTLNKLFITDKKDLFKQNTKNEFNNNKNNNLYLKFPTYIGGFDYQFYY